jgi:cell division protein FtsB
MYQKNNADGLQSIATTVDSWQNEGILTDILSFEPSNLAFTPTTLAAMESTLESFESCIDETMSDDYTTSDDEMSNMSDQPTAAKRARTSTGTVSSTSAAQPKPRRLPGPKSSIRTEDLTPEEQRRRQRRRERNKQAAARCRQRRVDVTNTLLNETQQLEAEAQKLEREIESLRKQRDQLAFVLEAHRPSCRADVPEIVKMEPQHSAAATATASRIAYQQHATAATAVRPSTLPIAHKLAPTNGANAAPTAADLAAAGSLSFNFDTTGFTPVVSSSGMGLFLGTGSDFASPTTLLLLSPSALIAP